MSNHATPAPNVQHRPASLAACVAEPMSRVDGCPDCTHNTEAPRAYIPLPTGYRCAYLCADCGRAWTTDYEDAA